MSMRSRIAVRSGKGGGWTEVAALAGMGLVVACARPPAAVPSESAPALVETAPASDGTNASTDSGALPSVSPDADTSLALGVYRAAGVPEIDRVWSARDYERCLGVFADLVRSGRSDLPRRGSPRSGALFARLVAVENFRSAEEAAPPERQSRLAAYLAAYPGLLQVYSPANDGIDFSLEQTELIASLFELLKSALDSSRALAPADAAAADAYSNQKQMALGVVRGASAMLAEPERYALPLRQYLRAALVRSSPAFEQHLEPSAASEVRSLAAASDTESR